MKRRRRTGRDLLQSLLQSKSDRILRPRGNEARRGVRITRMSVEYERHRLTGRRVWTAVFAVGRLWCGARESERVWLSYGLARADTADTTRAATAAGCRRRGVGPPNVIKRVTSSELWQSSTFISVSIRIVRGALRSSSAYSTKALQKTAKPQCSLLVFTSSTC